MKRILFERINGVASPFSDERFSYADFSPIRSPTIDDKTVRNLSPVTQRPYVSAVSKFSRNFGRSPDKLDVDKVRYFQEHLVSKVVF